MVILTKISQDLFTYWWIILDLILRHCVSKLLTPLYLIFTTPRRFNNQSRPVNFATFGLFSFFSRHSEIACERILSQPATQATEVNYGVSSCFN